MAASKIPPLPPALTPATPRGSSLEDVLDWQAEVEIRREEAAREKVRALAQRREAAREKVRARAQRREAAPAQAQEAPDQPEEAPLPRPAPAPSGPLPYAHLSTGAPLPADYQPRPGPLPGGPPPNDKEGWGVPVTSDAQEAAKELRGKSEESLAVHPWAVAKDAVLRLNDHRRMMDRLLPGEASGREDPYASLLPGSRLGDLDPVKAHAQVERCRDWRRQVDGGQATEEEADKCEKAGGQYVKANCLCTPRALHKTETCRPGLKVGALLERLEGKECVPLGYAPYDGSVEGIKFGKLDLKDLPADMVTRQQNEVYLCPHVEQHLAAAYPQPYEVWRKVRAAITAVAAAKRPLPRHNPRWFRRDLGFYFFLESVGVASNHGKTLHRWENRGEGYTSDLFYWVDEDRLSDLQKRVARRQAELEAHKTALNSEHNARISGAYGDEFIRALPRANVPGEQLPGEYQVRTEGSGKTPGRLLNRNEINDLFHRYREQLERRHVPGVKIKWGNAKEFLHGLPPLPFDWAPRRYTLKSVKGEGERVLGPGTMMWVQTRTRSKATLPEVAELYELRVEVEKLREAASKEAGTGAGEMLEALLESTGRALGIDSRRLQYQAMQRLLAKMEEMEFGVGGSLEELM